MCIEDYTYYFSIYKYTDIYIVYIFYIYNPVAISISNDHIVVLKYCLPLNKQTRLLREICKMSLDYLAMPDSRKAMRDQ